MHVALCWRATHALSQRAVHACNGQCRQQGVVNVWLAVGEAQQLHFELGTDIVVERKPGAVGYVVVRRRQAQLAYQCVHLSACLPCRVPSASVGGCQLVEHRLGIEVVALLHHGVHHLADAVCASSYERRAVGRQCAFAHHSTGFYACLAQPAVERADKVVVAAQKQRDELGVLVVPAPAAA